MRTFALTAIIAVAFAGSASGTPLPTPKDVFRPEDIGMGYKGEDSRPSRTSSHPADNTADLGSRGDDTPRGDAAESVDATDKGVVANGRETISVHDGPGGKGRCLDCMSCMRAGAGW